VSGISCPGYSNVKPARLKWLAPGRILSRNHRPKDNKAIDNSVMVATTSGPAYVSRTADWDMPCLTPEGTAISALCQAAEYCKSLPMKGFIGAGN
jgi:hypothetical protein